jgi:hypothetical protein
MALSAKYNILLVDSTALEGSEMAVLDLASNLMIKNSTVNILHSSQCLGVVDQLFDIFSRDLLGDISINAKELKHSYVRY